VSNEAGVKPADIRAGRQRLGHPRPNSVRCSSLPARRRPGGSEERKRPKGFRRIIGCAARRRLSRGRHARRAETCSPRSWRRTDDRDEERSASPIGRVRVRPTGGGPILRDCRCSKPGPRASGWRWPPLVAMVNEAFERVTAARLRSRSPACSRGLTGRGHCRASSLRIPAPKAMAVIQASTDPFCVAGIGLLRAELAVGTDLHRPQSAPGRRSET
jgi:hypothetical protein